MKTSQSPNMSHHPTTETLVELATGRLDVGRSLVVAAHLETCTACSRQMRVMETVGGQLLSGALPEPMAPEALARTLARIDSHVSEAAEPTEPQAPDDLPFLPLAARPYRLGSWQWIGPGVHRRMLELPDDSGARVFLLKARPGTHMPDHTHTGTELTLVLAGAFSHAGGRYGQGDFEEADDTVHHQPVVEAGETCICLVAMEGTLKLRGLTGRILQPFVRI
jgi:putative transcriptional regulator